MLLLAAILVVLGILVTLGVGVGVARTDVCRHCEYSTEGLEAPLCPECGHSLAGAGTRRKGEPRRILRLSAVVRCIGLFLTLVLITIGAGLVLAEFPVNIHQRREVVLTNPAGWNVRVIGKCTSTDSDKDGFRKSQSLEAVLRGAGEECRFSANQLHLSYRGRDGIRIQSSREVDEAALHAWATACIADPGVRDSVIGESGALLRTIRLVYFGPQFMYIPPGLSVSSTPTEWRIPATPKLLSVTALYGGSVLLLLHLFFKKTLVIV